MASAFARYDGRAEWYDENFAPHGDDAAILGQLLGDGDGQVRLDVACGTGRYAATVATAGYDLGRLDAVCIAIYDSIANGLEPLRAVS